MENTRIDGVGLACRESRLEIEVGVEECMTKALHCLHCGVYQYREHG